MQELRMSNFYLHIVSDAAAGRCYGGAASHNALCNAATIQSNPGITLTVPWRCVGLCRSVLRGIRLPASSARHGTAPRLRTNPHRERKFLEPSEDRALCSYDSIPTTWRVANRSDTVRFIPDNQCHFLYSRTSRKIIDA